MRHLTKRALAMLAGWDTFGCPFNELACDGRPGAEDQVSWAEAVARGLTPSNSPTCPRCSVLLDQALENAEVAP